jgi:hypothetical protein
MPPSFLVEEERVKKPEDMIFLNARGYGNKRSGL